MTWACVSVLALSAAGDQAFTPASQAAGTGAHEASNRTATAVPNAVPELAVALMNITSPDAQPSGGAKVQTGPRHRPGRLLVKFKELYGGNYTAIAQLVNDWAGIDLIKVSALLWTCCMFI